MPKLEFDSKLIQRYDTTGPRYTSYPTAVQFTSGFTAEDYAAQAELSNQTDRPLSLYFHIPFCDTICFYCACNKIVTKNRNHAQPYLDNLYKEIAMQGALFASERTVDQLHWGGGTPTFISPAQMQELMDHTRRHFNLRNDDKGEYSIEVDPREASHDTILLLRKLGFNRISLGVQDFNPQVQQAVNRIQSLAQTKEIMQAARVAGFHSISLDLIYGLPRQTLQSFSETLDTVLELQPDRLSVFNYAHLPELFKTQRQINAEELPDAKTKLAILETCIDKLGSAGYQYIGMDHFARPDDELALAQANGTLYRNFQGYSTHADCDLIGMGITSIGKINDCYSQNVKTLDEYAQLIAAGKLPILRGLVLNDDDKLRREIITQLICHYRLDIAAVEESYGIRFQEYFADSLPALQQMQLDDLLVLDEHQIQVKPKGCLLIRNICMTFDRYLQNSTQRFSKVL